MSIYDFKVKAQYDAVFVGFPKMEYSFVRYNCRGKRILL